MTGRVTTPDGWPVPEAVLTVTDPAGRQAARVAADGDAAFTAAGLTAGTYTVIATAPGHHPMARTATVTPDRHTDLGAVTLTRTGALTLPTPGVWTIDPVHSSVQATATHLGLGHIHGRFTAFTGQLTVADPFEDSTVEVTIDPTSLDTHHVDRDAHLRSPDFLHVDRYPSITYTGRVDERPDRTGWMVGGSLTLLDITHPMRLRVTYHGTGPDPWGGTRAGFSATGQLARDDFAITWDQAVAAGVTAFGRSLRIDVDIEAVQQ